MTTPATRPQNAEPIDSSVSPDAVTMNVTRAASRWRRSCTESMTEAGWLEAGADGSVFFGREMHYYGSDYAVHNDLISRAHLVILGLVRSHDETAQLCMLEGNKYTVVLSENSSRPFNISSDIGVKVPIPWTASGRLLLGHLSADEILALIPEEDFVLAVVEHEVFLRNQCANLVRAQVT